jgi:protein phosphatase
VTKYRLEFAARSDRGLVRSANEDAFGTLPEDGMVVVADGMGGYKAGEVASQLAVDRVLRHLNRCLGAGAVVEQCLAESERAVEAANLAIWEASDKSPEFSGMGTTVVLGVFLEEELAFAWVGDSRLYLVRQGALIRLTTDHTLVQEMVDQGLFESVDEATTSGVGNNVLTRALGAEEPVEVDTGSVEVEEGDLFLFCTDGLTHMVDDAVLRGPLSDPDLDLPAKADRLLRSACEAGGLDNITLVLVRAHRATKG